MKKLPIILISIVLLGLFVSIPAFGSDVFVVHGINGQDLGLAQELPVDISISGSCALTAVQFGNIQGPLTVDPGQYIIEVRLSDGNCTGTLAITATFDIAIGENTSVVAHLTEQGTPKLTKFVNDVRPTDNSNARVVVRHGAAAPPVDVNIESESSNRVVLRNLVNSEQGAVELPAGTLNATIFLSGSSQPLLGPAELGVEPLIATLVYAVGSQKNGTFQIFTQKINLN